MPKRKPNTFHRALALLLSLSLSFPSVSTAQFLGDRNNVQGFSPSLSGVGTVSPFNVPGGAVSGQGLLPGGPVIRSLPGDDPTEMEPGTRRSRDGVVSAAEAPKPLLPNDFQKFVQETTGRSLPLYGASFFSEAKGDNAFHPANIPVSPDYVLGPGDQVHVRGWGALEIDVRAVVDRNGAIHIPRVGPVTLAGVRSSQAEQVIRTAIGRYYRDFDLSVSLGKLRGLTVYVVGQARKPGAYSVSSVSTLVSALFASGGPGPNGSMRRVQVKRGDQVVTELDLYDFIARGNKSKDVPLQDGDTIVIPPARGYVALMGVVPMPAVYELKDEGESIESLLALGGGLPVVADPRRVYLERMDPTAQPSRSVESFALDSAGLRKALRSGDLLSIAPVNPQFKNAVTLRGNVDLPARVEWKPGMRVRDLIQSRSHLMSRASVIRQNDAVLNEDDRRQAAGAFSSGDDEQSALPALPSSGTPDAARQRASAPDPLPLTRPREVRDDAQSLAQRIGTLVDEVNFEYAVVERVDPSSISVQLLPFHLGRALDDPQSQDNLALQAGDIVTVFSVNDVRVPQARRQVFVQVEGEVHKPGVYQMLPGEGIRDLIERAGGVTPDAYLFGAAFYREEVKRTQAANLDQLVRRLEAQMQSRLSTSAASASTGGAEAASTAQLRFQAEAAAQQKALERLRNLKPTGRILLGINPREASLSSFPGLRLEPKDKLVIPPRPDFVHVLGSVNTEAAMIWRRGENVQHYLDQSGMTTGASMDELFILRADGSVVSKGGRWFGGVSGAEVLPGDVIVLPEKADHESAWSVFTRNAKDITQIIYQFSLGAAAIKTLRQ